MRFKWVGRYSRGERLFRIARVVGMVGQFDGQGYSYKLSLGYSLWGWWRIRFKRELHGWILVLLGVRIHWHTSYGGTCV